MRRSNLLFGDTPITQAHPGWQAHLRGDRPARSRGETGLIGGGRICGHHLAAQPVLVVNFTATGIHPRFRDGRKGHYHAVGAAQRQCVDRLWRGACAGDTHGHRNGAIRLRQLADDGPW